MDSDQNLSRHGKKELKIKQREENQISKEKTESSKKLKNDITKYTIIAAVVLLIIFGGYYLIIKPLNDFKPYTSGFIHWHANYEVYLCGERQDFTKGYDFEEDHIGTLQLHTHNDNVIHIEDKVQKKEDIAIGHFFDNIRIPFSETQIMNKKNGDLCSDGKTGKVHMYINGVENFEFRNFILRKCDSSNIKQDCDKIDIKFE